VSIAVEVLDPRCDPEAVDWPDFMRAEQLHVPWDYGLMGIESRHSGNPTLLALARRDGRIVAAFAVTVCRRGAALRSSGPVGGRARWLPRWVEVHQPWLSGLPGWVFAEGHDPSSRRPVTRAVERALCRVVGAGCLGLFYRSVPSTDESFTARRAVLVRDAVGGTAVLDNAFSTMEDWIRSLSRGRRQAIRGQLRTVAADPDLLVRFEPARDDLDGKQLAGLLNGHRARLGRPKFDHRSPVSAEYLDALVRRPEVHTLTYHDRSGTLLAFATMIDHPVAALYQHWAALTKAEGGRQHLYFDSYARLVRHMVDHDRRSLSAGRGLAELKASLGFAERPLRVMLVPRVAVG